MTETHDPAERPGQQISTRRFDHQRGGDWPGSRGVVVEMESGALPTVYLNDAGEVEWGVEESVRVPADVFRAWARAVLGELDRPRADGPRAGAPADVVAEADPKQAQL